jgi:hypothetical protein
MCIESISLVLSGAYTRQCVGGSESEVDLHDWSSLSWFFC